MELSFLGAGVLGGLAVLVIPLLIHLISKRRARRVRFAPIELLLRSRKRTARSIRLRQILLLLLRTLLFACVALAIARPFLTAQQGPSATQSPLLLVVAIDTSASMHAMVDGRSLFSSARERALDELRGQPADVRTGAIACDQVPRDVAAPTFERAVVVDAVAALVPRFHKGDLLACVARAASLALAIAGEGERRVVVFSDLAAHGFTSSSPAGGAQAPGVTIEWRRAIDEEPPPNHAITNVAVALHTGRSGAALEVTFGVERFLGPAVDVTADLLVGGRRAARQSFSLLGGQSAERSFRHTLAPAASAALTQNDEGLAVVLGEDALALDNEVRLPFDIPEPTAVLIVDGAPQAVALRDEIFYLESALRDARGGQGRLTIEVIGTDQLTPGALAGQRVVILANVARVDDATATALVEHVRAGGGLLMTMGDRVDVDSWNRSLMDVLPAPLRGSKGQALLDDASIAEVLSFARFRSQHPVLRGLARTAPALPAVEGAVDELPGLGRVRTHTLMLLEPTSADREREVLVRFSNDAPALLERSVGGGRTMLLATTIDRDWSDLAIRPGFLPLVRQLVLYLAGALEDGGPRILRVGEPRRIRVPRGSEDILVQPPAGARVRVESSEAGEVIFQETTMPGLYRVFAGAAGGEARERREERFTVLIDKDEGDLTLASQELLERSTPAGAVTRTRETGDDDVALWPWLMLLAVALLAAESFVLLRGTRRDSAPRAR